MKGNVLSGSGNHETIKICTCRNLADGGGAENGKMM